MIVYLIVGALFLGYVAFHASTPERRRRWREGRDDPAAPLDSGDPLPGLLTDSDAGGHHHHDHGHGGGHSVDFDAGSGHHH